MIQKQVDNRWNRLVVYIIYIITMIFIITLLFVLYYFYIHIFYIYNYYIIIIYIYNIKIYVIIYCQPTFGPSYNIKPQLFISNDTYIKFGVVNNVQVPTKKLEYFEKLL